MKLTLIQRQVVGLIAVSTAIRLVLSMLLELGNDEVYYWTYASYPDLSHFDHPPMVGLLIQASTLNLLLTDDFFLRLGPILLAAADTWLMYRIGAKVKDEYTGLVAAVLFTSSVYCSLIAGFAIIPDAPELFFWLMALRASLYFLPVVNITRSDRLKCVLFGMLAGLAMLSKYHAAFLWVGAGMYVMLYNRAWLKDYSLYVAMFLSLVLLVPVVYWNATHDFITFTFHGERVTPSYELRLDYFFRELAGQIAYNNPINYVLIAIACVALMRKKMNITPFMRILLWNSLPLLFVFTGFSLFRNTLPHWTGPAFLGLTVIAAIYWSPLLKLEKRITPIVGRLMLPMLLLLVMVCAAVFAIDFSPFSFGNRTDEARIGDGDFTQDMYGWKSIGREFKTIALKQERAGAMKRDAGLISFKWFPAAHEDFYVAKPMVRDLYVVGPLQDVHEYFWINQARGGLTRGKDYYHIAVSNYYQDPRSLFGNLFERVEAIDTIDVIRSGTVVRKAFVFKLKNYMGA